MPWFAAAAGAAGGLAAENPGSMSPQAPVAAPNMPTYQAPKIEAPKDTPVPVPPPAGVSPEGAKMLTPVEPAKEAPKTEQTNPAEASQKKMQLIDMLKILSM